MKKINREDALKATEDSVRHRIEERNRVLSEEYLNWLSEFIKREESFDDEPNRVHYSKNYTPEEKEKINLVSTLFSTLSEYYDRNGIEYHIEKANFYNRGVTVNLTADTAIEMTLWCGQGALTVVSLIESGTGKIDIKDVIATLSKEKATMSEQKGSRISTEGKEACRLKVYSSNGTRVGLFSCVKIIEASLHRVEFIDELGCRHVILNDGGIIIIRYDEEDDGT